MKKNVGRLDRTVRLTVAVIIGAVAFLAQTWWLFIISGVLIATAAIGYCGLYPLLKINTCGASSPNGKK